MIDFNNAVFLSLPMFSLSQPLEVHGKFCKMHMGIFRQVNFRRFKHNMKKCGYHLKYVYIPIDGPYEMYFY